jgi:hypothetical protein
MKRRAAHLYLDEDIWVWLTEQAAKARCSVSEIVRRLVLKRMALK